MTSFGEKNVFYRIVSGSKISCIMLWIVIYIYPVLAPHTQFWLQSVLVSLAGRTPHCYLEPSELTATATLQWLHSQLAGDEAKYCNHKGTHRGLPSRQRPPGGAAHEWAVKRSLPPTYWTPKVNEKSREKLLQHVAGISLTPLPLHVHCILPVEQQFSSSPGLSRTTSPCFPHHEAARTHIYSTKIQTRLSIRSINQRLK